MLWPLIFTVCPTCIENVSSLDCLISVSKPDQLCHIQLHCMHTSSLWRPPCCTPSEPVQPHHRHRLPGATGRLHGIGMQPCVCGWQAICLHFIYHGCGAVNLHRCLFMTISLLVGLHLLSALLLLPCPATCASYHKSHRDTLMPLRVMSFCERAVDHCHLTSVEL